MTSTDILTEGQWGLLIAAERPLYDGYGVHAFTDCREREDSAHLAAMWADAYACAEAALPDADETSIQIECARRVAAAQATLAFGPEYPVMNVSSHDPRFDKGDDERLEAFDNALGNFLDEHAGDAADVNWAVKADDLERRWEVDLWLNGDYAGRFAITESGATAILGWFGAGEEQA